VVVRVMGRAAGKHLWARQEPESNDRLGLSAEP
jgi:hypothetical protein